MTERSYIPWNIAGIAIAITGFVIGSLKGVMGGGGVHSTVGAILGVTGAVIAFVSYMLERRRRQRLER